MYLKLKLKASQRCLIHNVIEEAIRISTILDIMVEFDYHDQNIQVDKNSNAIEVFNDWKNSLKN